MVSFPFLMLRQNEVPSTCWSWAACRQKGYEAYLLFVVQLKGAEQFRPNDSMDPAFGKALRHAVDSGVQILAMDCVVTPDSMTIDQPVPIILPYEK